jgi:hypothetical protein
MYANLFYCQLSFLPIVNRQLHSKYYHLQTKPAVRPFQPTLSLKNLLFTVFIPIFASRNSKSVYRVSLIKNR